VLTIPDVLAHAAATWPDATAVVGHDGIAWTFAELATRVAARGIDVSPGDRIALVGENSPHWIAAHLTVLAAGGVVVPLNPRQRDAERDEILLRAGCRRVIDTDAGDHRAASTARQPTTIEPDAVSHLQFTSGTTGLPKGVMLTHRGMVATTRAWVEITGLRPGDRYPVVNPFSHIGGHKTGLLAALVAGATVYPVPRFDAAALARLLEQEKITFLQGPPAMFQALLDAVVQLGPPPTSVRVAVTGSANIPPALVRRMQATLTLDAVHAGYGLTEATGVCTITRATDGLDVVTRTSGRAIPGVEVRIRDAHEPGAEGEILVRGPGVMRGYLDDPAATAEVIDADGWLATGDVGALDADGNLEIRDRLKDMVIVGGFNAYPAEIERVLGEHDGVLQAAVVGVPDARLGEVPVAFVVRARHDPPTDAELIEHVRDRLATYKVPRAVYFLNELPMNAIPKVDKVILANVARELITPSTTA
jgi:acyl-CoA synthetase (AMP-forming)/AMP-acid ligase II